MTPANSQYHHRLRFPRATRSLFLSILLAIILCSLQAGCSLFVMAGKMIWGDPKITCGFKSMTGVDLTKGKKSILIVVSTPEFIKGEAPSLDFDLADTIYRRMKRNGIDVVNPDEVLSWIDSIGGEWDDPSEIAREFDVDYIAHFNIEDFRFREENSPTMYRGHAEGAVTAFQVVKIDGLEEAQQVFVGDFRIDYPRMNPISSEQLTSKVFQKKFLDDLSAELSRHFYDYRMGENF